MEISIIETNFDDARFRDFYSEWQSEIERTFPDFTEEDAMLANIYILLLDLQVAGIFVYQQKGDEMHIEASFVAPPNRGKGLAKHAFVTKIKDFRDEGFRKIVISIKEAEQAFLRGVGFSQSVEHPDRMELNF